MDGTTLIANKSQPPLSNYMRHCYILPISSETVPTSNSGLGKYGLDCQVLLAMPQLWKNFRAL